MKVLAVDPGFGRCGVAVLDGDGRGAEVRFSACIETPAKSAFVDRLTTVIESVVHLIETHKPELFVIEGLFFSNNTKTALQVAEVRGALLYVATKAHVPIHEMHPGSTKIALTGYGKATKAQMMFMVEKLTKLSMENRLDDEFDAVALGLAALAENAHRATMVRSGLI
jgi:crossover junction endodeoxyribonuclease RuvC